MKEVGYDLSTHDSKSLDEFNGKEIDVAVTMGCGDACPLVLAKRREEWQIPDPKECRPTTVPRGPRPDRAEGQGTAGRARRGRRCVMSTTETAPPPAPAAASAEATEPVRALPDRLGRPVHGRRRPPGPARCPA